jgi:hypothetical protein
MMSLEWKLESNHFNSFDHLLEKRQVNRHVVFTTIVIKVTVSSRFVHHQGDYNHPLCSGRVWAEVLSLLSYTLRYVSLTDVDKKARLGCDKQCTCVHT